MKIAVVGAGSYVFGPSVLAQVYLEQQLPDAHLALIDPDLETIQLMADVGRRMAREQGLATEITVHVDRPDALQDADFVICCASPQMRQRFAADQAIVNQYIPEHHTSEFGGVAGISYSLRQIALIEAISDDMKRICPDAWLLDVSNPLPRVTQAASENGIKAAGFCSVSLSVYGMLSEIFGQPSSGYPYKEERELWDATTAGLNHFAWLIELRDRSTGTDLLPLLRERASSPDVRSSSPHALHYLRETGYLLVPGDDHTRDFLPPDGAPLQATHNPWHGSQSARRERLELLRDVGSGKSTWDPLLVGAAWEKPIEMMAALSGIKEASFHSLDLINTDGHVSNLPSHLVVETPCTISSAGVRPRHVTLPANLVPLCEGTGRVTDLIVRAARNRSRALVHDAVKADPTIIDKASGIAAIDACIDAHSDIIPAYI